MDLFEELVDKLNASVNMVIELGIVFDEIENQSCVFFMAHAERTLENPIVIEQILEFHKQLEH